MADSTADAPLDADPDTPAPGVADVDAPMPTDAPGTAAAPLPTGGLLQRLVAHRPAHPWLAAAAIVVVVALLLEGYVRWVENQFETLRAGDSQEMILKAERIDELARANPSVDVVFFGNSMMDTAISPVFFLRNSSGYASAYNAAVVGAPLRTRQRWSEEIVLDRLDAGTIVVGVHPIDLLHTDFLRLNQDPTQADVIFAKVLRETDGSIKGTVDRALNENIALVRNRGILRRPRSLWDATLRELQGQPKPKEFDVRTREQWEGWLKPDGEVAIFHKQAFKQESIKNAGPKLRENMDTDNFVTTELDELLTSLGDTGKRVILVIPPVPLDAWREAQVDLDALTAGNDLIRDIAAEHGMPVIDFTDSGYKNPLFIDLLHLNDKGSVRFSAELAAELDALGA